MYSALALAKAGLKVEMGLGIRMKLVQAALATALALATASPAHACRVEAMLDLTEVQYADLVVVGRIVGYQRVVERETRFSNEYARFSIDVNEALVGNPPKSISVTWNNSTFAEPKEMKPGPFLIALRNPRPDFPPSGGSNTEVRPDPETQPMTVLQSPCAPPFIFDASSKEAQDVRRLVKEGKASPQSSAGR